MVGSEKRKAARGEKRREEKGGEKKGTSEAGREMHDLAVLRKESGKVVRRTASARGVVQSVPNGKERGECVLRKMRKTSGKE